jgi:TRAP-type C4-dicarboxylate transport system substrate-binding protein
MRKHLFLAAGALALAFGSTAAIAADKKVNFRLSYWVPPKHKLTPGYKEWGDYVKKQTGGTVTFTLFPSSQLGSGRDHYDMVKRGIADIGLINPGYTPGRFPVVGTIDLPFLVSDGLKGAKAMTRFYAKYAPKEMSDVKVCHTFSHEPGTFHTVKKVTVPDDIKGMKIRTANATIASFVTSMGGHSVQVPIMEAFETLKRGITEGITVPWGGNITFSFGKVVKQHLDANLYVSTFVHTINLKKYNSLSAAQKKVIDETCSPEWASKIYRHWAAQETELKARIVKDKGQTINKIGAKELELWRKAAEPVYAQWAESVNKKGYDSKVLLSEIRAELKKEGALSD